MRIELLECQTVPCTDGAHRAFTGQVFDVIQGAQREPGVWIQHLGHPIFVPEGEYRELDGEAKAHDFISHRSCFAK